MHPAGFSGNARALKRWNVTGRLRSRSYKNPVLVASGNRDPLVSPTAARATARAFPVGQYVNLGDVGHGPQVKAPRLVHHLLAFLINHLRETDSENGDGR